MTKEVRVENADTSDHKILVEIWKSHDGVDTKIDTRLLNHPTDMTELMIWDGRYLIVREVPHADK